MKARHLILILLDTLGGKIDSKTKLHKEIYFISLLLNRDIGFKAHYYGPYSPKVEQGLDESIGAGFINMTREVFGMDPNRGFEFKRYDFSLTEPGKRFAEILKKKYPEEHKQVEEFVGKLQEIGNPDYLTLSLSAKAYFILNKEGIAMTDSQIAEKAGEFGWNVTEDDITAAITILEKLDLVERK